MLETILPVVGATLNRHRTALDNDVVTGHNCDLAGRMNQSKDAEGEGQNRYEGYDK
jgi:hypothetical protein